MTQAKPLQPQKHDKEVVRRGMDQWRRLKAESKAKTKSAEGEFRYRVDFLAAKFFTFVEMQRAGAEFRVKKFDEIDARLGAIERALDEGGAKSLVDAYAGVYRAGERYQRGQLVTDKGGLWFCQSNTDTRPGTGPHWVLAVKSGGR